jgi:hypothetical protein
VLDAFHDAENSTKHERVGKPLGIGCGGREHTKAYCLSILLPWSTPFDDPILLLRGRPLVTLKDAADYITKLPSAEQNKVEWQTAIHCLIGAAEGRDFLMHARVGLLRALNADKPREFTESKGHHWGKRKLKRDL